MPRIRTIKPDFCTSESVARLSRDSRLFFILLLTHVDDDGKSRNLPRKLGADLFPFDEDVSGEMVSKWIAELVAQDMVKTYRVDGADYLIVVNMKKHQKIDHPSKSYLPDPPPEDKSNSRDPRESRANDSRDSPTQEIGNSSLEIERKENQIKEKFSERAPWSDPSAESVYEIISSVPRFKSDFDANFESNQKKLEAKLAEWRSWVPESLNPDEAIADQISACVDYFKLKTGRIANIATIANWMAKPGMSWRTERDRPRGKNESNRPMSKAERNGFSSDNPVLQAVEVHDRVLARMLKVQESRNRPILDSNNPFEGETQ